MDFDASKGYKRLAFREDRDLLDTELNELQEIAIHERTVLMDRLFAPGTILDGLDATAIGTTLTLADGILYLDGHAVRIPGATLSFPAGGLHTVWVDVFRRTITAHDDPTLINPLTGEPTAEREQWIACLQTRDTTDDPVPDGATGRTVAAILTYEPDSGTVTHLVPRPPATDDGRRLDAHIGSGGATHLAATPSSAGFMSAADKAALDAVALAPPAHQHDDRYYPQETVDTAIAAAIADLLHGAPAALDTLAELAAALGDDAHFAAAVTQALAQTAPLTHVGAGDAAHAVATPSTAGFMSAADKARLDGLAGVPSGVIFHWSGSVETIPDGWWLCDGTHNTPDLRDRFLVGAGGAYPVGETGGEATHELSETELPAHTHQATYQRAYNYAAFGSQAQAIGPVMSDAQAGTANTDPAVASAGGGQAHENRPPYYALCYIMKA